MLDCRRWRPSVLLTTLVCAVAMVTFAFRLVAAPVRTAVTANGLVADLYTPAEVTGRLPAIIVLGGSEGGLGNAAAWEAWLIASHGYVALHLAYFNAPGQPQRLALIPLEYFKAAVDWLRSRPEVDPDRVGIMGSSIGGETALVVASYYPEIRAVVAGVPSSVIWPGIGGSDMRPPSTYTMGGRPLPALPYGSEGGFTSIYDLYVKGLTALDQHPDAVIPVERINGPTLLICGEADRLWPSCAMSRQIEARLKAKSFSHRVEVLAYADAGHFAFGPPVASDSVSFNRLASLGGSLNGNQAAREDAWPRALAFLDAALK
jgi:uncharacterized protein